MATLGYPIVGLTAAGTAGGSELVLQPGAFFYEISVGAANTGVQLPNYPQGTLVIIKNSVAANPINIWPPAGSQIGPAGGAGAAVALAGATAARYVYGGLVGAVSTIYVC